jgi:hypothetical protein
MVEQAPVGVRGEANQEIDVAVRTEIVSQGRPNRDSSTIFQRRQSSSMRSAGQEAGIGLERGMSPSLRPKKLWSRRSDLNRRPADYESAALPLSYVG